LILGADVSQKFSFRAWFLIVLSYKVSFKVVAFFAGHDHDGGYFQDEFGLHHWTFYSPLITAPGENCHFIIKLFEGKFSIKVFVFFQNAYFP
jgi:hypothetical protein